MNGWSKEARVEHAGKFLSRGAPGNSESGRAGST